jgi:hypothetical protein
MGCGMNFVMVLDGAREMRDWGGRNATAGRQRDAVYSSTITMGD